MSKMSEEQKQVVIPLYKWVSKQMTEWEIYMPPKPTTTGWDLELRRKNLYLCIEAKYITRSFIYSFSRLTTSPLTQKRLHLMKRNDCSPCARSCWAIGTSYQSRDIYQILLDYLIRHLDFWWHYFEDLKMQYVFFIENKKVARISFKNLLLIAEKYREKTDGKNTNERRIIAEQLTKRFKYG